MTRQELKPAALAVGLNVGDRKASALRERHVGAGVVDRDVLDPASITVDREATDAAVPSCDGKMAAGGVTASI